MGRGIAELMALAGFEVQLWDHQPSVLGRASSAIERSLRKQQAIGRFGAVQLDETLERLRLISDLRVVHPKTDLVIEAIVEDLAQKQEFFTRVEKTLPEAWYVTHTASLRISDIATAMNRPERLIGMHFFYPAPVMPLVEIAYSIKTDENWIRGAIDLAERDLGKQTIILKDTPGFVSSRLATSMALEAMRMYEENVASVEDIDRAMEYGYRFPMGPLRLSDWVGLDVRLQISRILYEELRLDSFKPPQILEQMVAEGKLGRKSGEGFYKWPKEP